MAIPARQGLLTRVLGRTHADYAHWRHVRRRQLGHLWDAIRQVELNPVRAGLVRSALDWRWSGANAQTQGNNGTPWHSIFASGWKGAACAEHLLEATRTG